MEIAMYFIIVETSFIKLFFSYFQSEDKSWKIPYNQDGCKIALQHALLQEYFPEKTRETVTVFLKRKECTPEVITLTT